MCIGDRVVMIRIIMLAVVVFMRTCLRSSTPRACVQVIGAEVGEAVDSRQERRQQHADQRYPRTGFLRKIHRCMHAAILGRVPIQGKRIVIHACARAAS